MNERGDRPREAQKKLTVMLPVSSFDAVEEVAVSREVTRTDVIRSAIALEHYLHKATLEGKILQLVDPETDSTTAIVRAEDLLIRKKTQES